MVQSSFVGIILGRRDNRTLEWSFFAVIRLKETKVIKLTGKVLSRGCTLPRMREVA